MTNDEQRAEFEVLVKTLLPLSEIKWSAPDSPWAVTGLNGRIALGVHWLLYQAATAAEREACAEQVDKRADKAIEARDEHAKGTLRYFGYDLAAELFRPEAPAIRARGGSGA